MNTSAASMTPKQLMKTAEPSARLDYYELLRKESRPCWFVRQGLQGPPLSDITSNPRDAWRNAYDGLREALRKKGGRK